MILSFLVILSKSESTGDIFPPFTETEKNKVGEWETIGSSYSIEDSILILPALQMRTGGIWTNQILPESFDVTFALNTPQVSGNGETGFAIWLIDSYGAEGQVYGGPNIFKGFGLLFSIVDNWRGSMKIDMRYIEDTKRGINFDITKPAEFPPPSATFHTSIKSIFDIKLRIRDQSLRVFVKSDPSVQFKQIYETNIPKDIAEYYFGLTAQTERFVSSLLLYGIYFNLTDQNIQVNRTISYPKFSSSGVYISHTSHHFRNPIFKETVYHLTHKKIDSTVDQLFDVLDELQQVSFAIATYKDINDYVSHSLLPIVTKWQTRTLKIVQRIKEARNVTGAALNSTEMLLYTMNSTLNDQVLKTSVKIIELSEILYEASSQGLSDTIDTKEISDQFRSGILFFWLTYIVIVEIIIIVIIAVIVNIPYFQRKIIDSMNKPRFG